MAVRHSRALILISLIAIVCAAYLPIWQAGFSWEDRPESFVGSGRTFWGLWTVIPSVRGLAMWTIQATLEHGGGARALHVTNLVMHMMNGALLYVWLRRLGWDRAAVIAAAIFALHPLQTEAVISIGYRTELFAVFGILLSAIGLTLRSPWRWGVLLAGLWITIGSKEVGVMAPAMLLLIAMQTRSVRVRIPRWSVAAIVVSIVVVLSAWRGPVFHQVAQSVRAVVASVSVSKPVYDTGMPSELGLVGYASMQSCVVLNISRLVVVPIGQMSSHSCERVRPPILLLSLFALFAALCVTARRYLVSRLTSWPLMAWWCAVLWTLPRFLIPSREFITEHHFYVPMLFLSSTLALWFVRYVPTARFSESPS